MNDIYLDNASSTMPYPEVTERVCQVLGSQYGNAHSVHYKGMEAFRIISRSAETIANILGCDPTELVFTSGGTESNNLAVKGYAFANRGRGRHILTTEYEHASVRQSLESLRKFDFEPGYIPIGPDKSPDIAVLGDRIRKDTILTSMVMVNSETGSMLDIAKTAAAVKKANARCAFHTDAVQGFLKYEIRLDLLEQIDMMSFSAHKIRGPKGIGLLFVRKKTNLEGILSGGNHQNGLRAGTENTPLIAGFAMACELTHARMKNNFMHVSNLKNHLLERLSPLSEQIMLLSPGDASPYILSVSFKGIKGEVLLNHLSSKGICLSAGSACSSRTKVHSHVLEAMHVPKEFMEGAIRFSFNEMNTTVEIDAAVGEIMKILPGLQAIRRK
ncbi:MAG: cysteine desulfurase family protein [Clostridia bacterium]